jgi:hypothetical protein
MCNPLQSQAPAQLTGSLNRLPDHYRTPASGVFRRKDFGFVACGNNRASVSQFVARIGRCPIAARRPNLHNIIGRKAGSLPNYGYSSAMKGAELRVGQGKARQLHRETR